MIAAYCAAGLIFAGLGTTALVQQNNFNRMGSSKNASVERWEELNEQGQAEFNSGKYSLADATFSAELDMAKKLKNKQLRLCELQRIARPAECPVDFKTRTRQRVFI